MSQVAGLGAHVGFLLEIGTEIRKAQFRVQFTSRAAPEKHPDPIIIPEPSQVGQLLGVTRK